jgi:hypothetical protein
MRSVEIEAHRGALLAFGEHFQELLDNMEPVEAPSFLTRVPRWIPKPGREARVYEVHGKLSSLTGSAAAAVEAAGVFIDYKHPGRHPWQTEPMNPIPTWPTLLTDNPMIDANLIIHCYNVALGNLATAAARAYEVEHSLAGVVGRFLLFPSRVREAAGLPRGSVRGRLAFGAGIVAQIFVAVVGGLLLALLLKWLGLGD